MNDDIDLSGQCDTPNCNGRASAVTPDGYVCPTCARRLEAHYREAERRERRAVR